MVDQKVVMRKHFKGKKYVSGGHSINGQSTVMTVKEQ